MGITKQQYADLIMRRAMEQLFKDAVAERNRQFLQATNKIAPAPKV